MGDSHYRIAFNFITPGWLAAYGTALRAGRDFAVRDTAGSPPVAIVNDAFVGFSQSDPEIDRLRGGTVTIDYPWIEGQAYAVTLVTSTGGTVDAAVDVAAETPETDAGFLGLMALGYAYFLTTGRRRGAALAATASA